MDDRRSWQRGTRGDFARDALEILGHQVGGGFFWTGRATTLAETVAVSHNIPLALGRAAGRHGTQA